MQRIGEGEVLEEVELSVDGQYLVDRLAGHVADLGFVFLHRAWQERPVDHAAVCRVLGRVHERDGVHDPGGTSGQAAGEVVAGLIVEDGVVHASGEELGVSLDGHDVGVLGDQPDRVEALELGQPERVVGAQPGIGWKDGVLLVGVGARQHSCAGDLVRNQVFLLGGCLLRHYSISFRAGRLAIGRCRGPGRP